MNLPSHLTFTGVDTRTNLGELSRIASLYPVEFAILAGTSQRNRYPPTYFIRLFSRLSTRKALHLCGKFSADAMAGREGELDDVTARFNRLQFNSTAPDPAGIWRFSAGCRGIAQTRADRFPDDARVMWLFDRSGGRGELPTKWPTHPGRLVGYAGGINAGNVLDVIDKIDASGPYWLDMETGVRDADDWFSLAECERVCQLVYGKLAA